LPWFGRRSPDPFVLGLGTCRRCPANWRLEQATSHSPGNTGELIPANHSASRSFRTKRPSASNRRITPLRNAEVQPKAVAV